MNDKGWLFFATFTLVGGFITLPAYAYLDGGTGSVLLQGLFAGTVGLIAVLRIYWQRAKSACSALKARLLGKPTSADTTASSSQDHTSDAS